jgi:heat shock protein HtpX
MTNTLVAAPLNADECRRHRWRNRVQSLILLGGIVGLFALCAVLIFGWVGGGLVALVSGVMLAFSPSVSPRLILSLYRARPLTSGDLPAGYDVLQRLAQRAALPRIPALFYVPSGTLNAFTVGRKKNTVIVVTDGMLRTLSLREFAGILAHEVSHIRNDDLWIMNLADSINRLTALMAHAGFSAIILLLPLSIIGAVEISFLWLPLLVFAPVVATLLQLALSRAREYDADLDAAGLTGDPKGLASALDKLECGQAGTWERLLMPGRSIPLPSSLRTHPLTEERIKRLLSLQSTLDQRISPDQALMLPERFPVARGKPSWRLSGLWY